MLAPRRCSRAEAERLLRLFARLEKLASAAVAVLSARLDDPTELARVAGTSVGRARGTIETGRRVAADPRLAAAAARAEISVDQADEIARAAAVAPGAVDGLLAVARSESFHVLKRQARQVRLAAQDPATLARRQHQARRLRHWVGELGMICIEAALEPHIGTPIVNRLQDHARRLTRNAKNNGDTPQRFQCHLADALPAITNGDGIRKGHTEMVILVSHQITQRGWEDTKPGEHCKIPGVGPIAPQTARRIAQDAFLTALFYDGQDLRHLKRWTRGIPTPIRTALQLGEPPGFDGPRCIDCGNRYNLQVDHIEPLSNGGPTSVANTGGRCTPCHIRKTTADRQAGKTHHHPHTNHHTANNPHAPLPLPP